MIARDSALQFRRSTSRPVASAGMREPLLAEAEFGRTVHSGNAASGVRRTGMRAVVCVVCLAVLAAI
jgi:hypothetical protein